MSYEDDELMRQQESVSGAPRIPLTPAVVTFAEALKSYADEPHSSWPMMVYVLPNGEVIARREMKTDECEFGSPGLAHRSFFVFRVIPGSHVIDVLKFRGDVSELFRSASKENNGKS